MVVCMFDQILFTVTLMIILVNSQQSNGKYLVSKSGYIYLALVFLRIESIILTGHQQNREICKWIWWEKLMQMNRGTKANYHHFS